MNPHQLESTLFKLCHLVNKAERECGEAEIVFEGLEDFRKEMFESMVDKAEGKNTAEKERAARISREWNEWKIGFAAAKSNFIMAKVKKFNAKRNWETCRSIMSSKNTERKTGV